MSPIYDFVCSEGHFIEDVRKGYDDEFIDCPHCGEPAARVAGYASQFLVTETGAKNERRTPWENIPDNQKQYHLKEFQEACEERDYYHKQAEGIAGKELPSKHLYTEAKKRAHAIATGKLPRPKPRFVTAG